METLNLVQGSEAWLAHRLHHHNASDAPAMMGCSPYKTRSQLVREYATGLREEVDAATQRIFDDGHRFEALARPLAEEIIGEELYPVVGTAGKLSASFDGLTMLEETSFEHKSVNNDLRAAMAPGCTGTDLPLCYQVQMTHQCMVSTLTKRVLFMASKWDGDVLVEERHCWFEPSPELAAKIAAGWAQFEADVAAYSPEAPAPAAPAGRAPSALPALRIEVSGQVTASNLAQFKAHALAVFEDINTDLQTDQDFADADKTVKWCSEVEERLAAAKQHALSQTETIDALFRALDEIGAQARKVRLDLANKVKTEKEARRLEVITKAQADLDAHVLALNARLGHVWIGRQAGDFGEAIKGKKSIDTCRDAASTRLASLKVELSGLADRLAANRKALIDADGVDSFFLFADFAVAGAKPAEDFEAIAAHRIATHAASEKARREREDAAKAAAAPPSAPAPVVPVVAAPAPASRSTFADIPAASNVGVLERPAHVATDSVREIKLGDINAALGFVLNQAFIVETLGIKALPAQGSAVRFRASDFERIRTALIRHVQSRAAI